jgi:TolB-like protein
VKRFYILDFILIFMVIFFYGWILDLNVMAADRNRISVLPFQINAEKDMDYLQKGISEILESRLAGIREIVTVSPVAKVDFETFEKIATRPDELRNTYKEWNIDYIVYGSITIVGKHSSLDVKVVNISGDQGPWSFFRKMDSMDDLIPATEAIADEIGKTVFKVTLPGKTIPSSAENDQLTKQKKQKEKVGIWKSSELPIQIFGIGVGDIDANGNMEIVAASGHDIHIFHIQGKELVHHGEIKGEIYHSYLSIDVADVNKNGTAEIYISCENSRSGSLTSFVMEWDGRQFSPIIQDQNWYFRVVRTENGNQLLGQKKGVSYAYIPEIYELAWKDTTLVTGRKKLLPGDTMVFSVSNGFIGQNKDLVAAFDSRDRLCMINDTGSVAWKSDVPYGGREQFVKTIEDYQKNEGERFYLPQRTFSIDIEEKPTVIVPFNDSSSGRFFQKLRSYSNARFLFLTWDDIGLSIIKKSQDLSGYVSDFCVADLNNDGLEELIYALVAERESAFRSGKSYIATEGLSELIIQHP